MYDMQYNSKHKGADKDCLLHVQSALCGRVWTDKLSNLPL